MLLVLRNLDGDSAVDLRYDEVLLSEDPREEEFIYFNTKLDIQN